MPARGRIVFTVPALALLSAGALVGAIQSVELFICGSWPRYSLLRLYLLLGGEWTAPSDSLALGMVADLLNFPLAALLVLLGVALLRPAGRPRRIHTRPSRG